MATQAYKEYAPTLEGAGVTKTYCDSVKLETKTYSTEQPNITKTKAEKVVAKFADLEKANGFKQIAIDNDLTTSQVKKLYKEFLLTKNPPEKEEEVVEEEITKE
jgi:hypothetical protein